MVLVRPFPDALHVCTYDVRGRYVDSGMIKPARMSGIVEHTHQLLAGLVREHPETRIAITQTGGRLSAAACPVRPLQIPDGPIVQWRSVATGFPQYLRREATGGKDPALVQLYYEERIDDPANPVWLALAEQYTAAVRAAGTAHLLVQGLNPLVAVLKAERFGVLAAAGLDWLNVTAVVHDTASAGRRLGYVASRIDQTGLTLKLIAVSGMIRQGLIDAGVPAGTVTTVLNGLDADEFGRRIDGARGVFPRVAARNCVPLDGRVVLVSARRVPWKGHQDVIEAAGILRNQGRAGGIRVVINGAGMSDSRWPSYDHDLAAQINRRGLNGTVVLLDELDPTEVASCYTAADVAVLASREPEPFGYANIEAMLAGVPVITTNHGGPAEYIEDGVSGLLVPPSQPAAIAQALDRLLHDSALHGGLASAGRAAARRLNLRAMADAYMDLITRQAPADTFAGAGSR
ncbi:glycosyltransferase family 4 protein [Frankia sp. CiP3]|uniref:glycosyltransferase family 4 protein n=1 Tax=Frankia sp. CiP3 TaxID=2880971 RepID=UPI001EF3DF53|nr:glycosyltransferase family 4 protein [Frankia sp. CiP3]